MRQVFEKRRQRQFGLIQDKVVHVCELLVFALKQRAASDDPKPGILTPGHDPLRRILHKPGAGADVLRAVQTIKTGGVDVGLIIMVGVGGERFRHEHFADTVQLLQQMPLADGDIIYASPFVADPESPYARDQIEQQTVPLGADAIDAEERRFREALLPWARRRGVRLSRYDIREFIY